MAMSEEETPLTFRTLPQQQAASSVRRAEEDKEAKLQRKRLARQRQRQRKKGRKLVDPKFWGMNMDPEVWGNLPPNLTLEIFQKLPIREFYQLREVCKDWNRVARERRCITDPIHKPYFVLILEGDEDEHDHYLHGILTYHIKSGRWRWKNLHGISFNTKLLYKPCSVKGLTFSRYALDSHRVFDANSNSKYTIPQVPKITAKARALGMAVDTSVVPHTFKIILGSLDTGTQVYDSVTNSWETRSSLLARCQKPNFKTCLHCGDHLYIWSQLDKILVYSLQEDTWSTLNPPPRHPTDLFWRGLGSWEGRLFTVMTGGLVGGYVDEEEGVLVGQTPLVLVWELVDQSKQEWSNCGCMPSDIQGWLTPRRIQGYDVRYSASFCNEHVLVCSWVPAKGRAYRFALYNLRAKKWETMQEPTRSVSIQPESEKDTRKWDDFRPVGWDDSIDEQTLNSVLLSVDEPTLCDRHLLEYRWGPYFLGGSNPDELGSDSDNVYDEYGDLRNSFFY